MPESNWGLIASLIRPHRRAFARHGLLLGAATALPILASLLIARFVDLVVHGAELRRLVPYGIGYAVTGLLSSAVQVLVTWRSTVLAWRVTNGLRHELASHVLHADLAFHRDRTPGELLTRCDADVTSLTVFLSVVVARIVGVALVALAGVIVLVVVEPLLAPVLVVGYTIVGLTIWKLRNVSTAAVVAERTVEAEMYSAAEQYLAGADDVIALGAGAHGLRRFAEPAGQLVDAAGERVRMEMRFQGSIKTTTVLCEIGILAVGAALLATGHVGVAGVMLGFRLVAIVRQPVEHLTWRLQEAQGISGAAQRVLEMLNERRRVVSGSAVIPPGIPGLELRDVGLVYDDASPGEHALRHLNLTIGAGRVVGLVGRTGSGKTTIARLALRLVAPTSGQVLVGGTDITALDDDAFRRRVGAIPQDVQLFPGSVRDNVALFAVVDDAEVIVALRDAGLGIWFDELPNGLDTQLTADGRTDASTGTGLSAGEAQLLAIARALLRRPDFVVLDEATSRVDPVTQAAISGALARLVRGRTAIVIAHRLETLDVCDDIVVLADGEVIESGERMVLGADPTSRYARLRAVGAEAEELA